MRAKIVELLKAYTMLCTKGQWESFKVVMAGSLSLWVDSLFHPKVYPYAQRYFEALDAIVPGEGFQYAKIMLELKEAHDKLKMWDETPDEDFETRYQEVVQEYLSSN